MLAKCGNRIVGAGGTRYTVELHVEARIACTPEVGVPYLWTALAAVFAAQLRPGKRKLESP